MNKPRIKKPITVECCGQSRKTMFCADCGRRLMADPLSDLIDYLRKQTQAAMAGLSTIKAKSDTSGDALSLARTKKATATAEKWQAWLTAVVQMRDGI